MIHGQHLNKTLYHTPLFKNCLRAQPFSQSVPTWYLMLENQQADLRLHNYNLCKYLCPIVSNDAEHSCFIVMEGEDLQTFINTRLTNNHFPILTEEQIWSLIICVSEGLAYLKQNQCHHLLTHFKQYSIRKIDSKKMFKFVFHQSMVSQLNAAKSGVLPWQKLYLSPQELNGEFLPEKSIVFSLGSILLHLCAFQDREISLYEVDKFKVDQKVIKNKLILAKEENGYSRLLCNFIEQCLVLDADKRFDFCDLKQAVKRKLERQYNKQSDILSQIMVLEKGQSISYEITMPRGYQFSSKSPAHSHNRHTRTQSDQIYDKSEIVPEQKLQLSNVEPEQESQSSAEEVTRKIKKKSKAKFEGSKVSKAKNQSLKKDENAQTSTEIQSIDYRGTFGARNMPLSEHHQTKARIKKQKSQSEEQQPAQHTINEFKDSQLIEQKQIIQQTKKKEGYRNIKIEIPHKKNDEHPQEDVETPKGFGRQFHKFKNILEDKTYHQEKLVSQQQIPQLLEEMKYLRLDQCLQPVQNIARSLGKIGVWVQGDLYYGDFLNGRRDGLGLQIFTNGQYYFGFFKEDLFYGEGFYYWNSRQYFFGKFELGQKVSGRLEGQIQYQGGFKDNKRSGQGTCWYSTGEIYTGDWLNGKKHGKGTLILPDGSKFVGNWIKGKRKGQGYLETQLMKIKGVWNDEQIEGLAFIEYINGDIFEGKIGKTLMKLKGKYASNSGRVFIGEFQNDMPRRGEMLYSNGDKYIGELQNLRRHGYGQYYYVSGQVYKGEWQNNSRKS